MAAKKNSKIQGGYVDGFVIPVPKEKVSQYRKIARLAGKVWMEHGALQYVECVGEDLEIEGMTSFNKIAKVKEGETVIFSWILYKSKAERNKINKKVMKDERLANFDPKTLPFNHKRMSWGGFKVLVNA